jgi:DNA-binding transcriptional LysR family regulator
LVAVPETHRLARRGTVDVAELEGEAWIVGDGGDGPQFGVWPGLSDTSRIAYTVRDWTARLGLVAVGLGLAVIPTLAADTVPSGVRLIAVDDPRPVHRSAVVVTLPDRSPSVDALVRALREEGSAIARSVGQSGP